MLIPNSKKSQRKIADKLDGIITHKYLGVIIFLIVLWIVFQATFGLGYYPMHWIEQLFFISEKTVAHYLPESVFKSLLLFGILKGVGGVVIFLPNIVILFLLLSLMEETGYMARVTLVMDKLMKHFGLSGKSFISLIMGFGCNVPAIMAAQSIENKNSRLITILINPLMSCGARFTVYIMFISAFFPDNSGTVLFFLYFFSIIIATVLALILKKFIFKSASETYNEDLPLLQLPSLKKIIRSIWNHSILFLKKITGAILIASVVIWLLTYFPHRDSKNLDIEHSYIGMLGKFIEPVISPLGFDWRMGISVITGIAAKETITGTLNELYQNTAYPEHDKASLIRNLKSQTYTTGEKKGLLIFSPLVALSFMFFVSLYTPCIATITSIRKTTKSNKWSFFVIVYTTLLAWLVSFAIYNIGSLIIN